MMKSVRLNSTNDVNGAAATKDGRRPASGVATGGQGGASPPLVPRTDCGIRPAPMRSW